MASRPAVTRRAREAKTNEGLTVIFLHVEEDAQAMAEMLRLTQGNRQVRVLMEGGEISIGFGGT